MQDRTQSRARRLGSPARSGWALVVLALLLAPAAFGADERPELTPEPRPGQNKPADPNGDRGSVAPGSSAKHGKGKGRTRPQPAEPAPAPPAKRLLRTFAPGTIDQVMREAFHCALDLSDSDGFDCYTQLNCEMNRDTDIALGHLRTYQWRFFRQRASTYVADPKEFAVEVTRRDPETVGPATKDAKIFLHSTLRDNPAPISFRREEGVWRIYSNSL